MSMVDRVLSAVGMQRKSVSADTLDAVIRAALIGGPGKSGQPVTLMTALQVTTVFACARVISEGIAQVPWKLYRPDGRGRMAAREHPLYDLLHGRPNPFMTSFEFRETIGFHLALTNNAYIFINRSARGEVLELLPWQPQDVEVKRRTDHTPSYRFRTQNGWQEMPEGTVWHIRGPSWDGLSGLDPVRLAREAIGLGLATEEHGARMFSNGAQVPGVLKTAGKVSEEYVTALKTQFAEKYQGGANAYKPMILAEGLEWQSIALNSDNAQFLETRRYQVEEICRAFRVMPIMVGYSDKAQTYASAEQMFLAHVVHTLTPWFERIEQSANLALLTREERARGLYTKFTLAGLLRGSMKDWVEYVTKLASIGVLSPNDIREMLELNPYAGGDEYRVPMNTETPGAADNKE